MTATQCAACNRTFERGVGQSHSIYCSAECRRENRRAKGSSAEGAKPTPYQKGDGNWYCTYQGRQHYLGNNLFKAERKLEEILSGEIAPKLARGPTVEALIQEYLATIEHVQSPDTIKTKRIFYKQFLEFLGDGGTTSAITAQKLEEYKQSLFKRGLVKTTVRNQLMLLSAFFDYAVRTKVLPSNPVSEIATIKQSPDPDPDHLTEEEVGTLLDLTKEQRYEGLQNRDRLVFLLMLHAGLRRIEVSNLRWSDIDLQRRLIILRTTKGQKPRVIGINETLREALEDCQENWKENEEYVITNRKGRKMSRESLTTMAKRYLDKLNHSYLGKKRFSLHSLRATFATQLASKGVGTRVIQGLLGHSDPRTTMRYAAYTEKMAVDAVKVLDS